MTGVCKAWGWWHPGRRQVGHRSAAVGHRSAAVGTPGWPPGLEVLRGAAQGQADRNSSGREGERERERERGSERGVINPVSSVLIRLWCVAVVLSRFE